VEWRVLVTGVRGHHHLECLWCVWGFAGGLFAVFIGELWTCEIGDGIHLP